MPLPLRVYQSGSIFTGPGCELIVVLPLRFTMKVAVAAVATVGAIVTGRIANAVLFVIAVAFVITVTAAAGQNVLDHFDLIIG